MPCTIWRIPPTLRTLTRPQGATDATAPPLEQGHKVPRVTNREVQSVIGELHGAHVVNGADKWIMSVDTRRRS